MVVTSGEYVGKTVLVTGAASGIGRAIAVAFAQCGARLALLDWNADESAHLARDLRQTFGCDALPLQCDIRSSSAVAEAFFAVEQVMSGLDVLVCAAGVREIVDSLDITPEQWEHTIAVDLSGTFFCCQAAARGMSRSGGGAIVNIASVTGLVGEGSRPAYTAAKHGVVGLTKALAVDLARHHIRVNAICPGLIRTPLTERYFVDPSFADQLRLSIPMGGAGHPDDIGAVAVFLAGEGARYVTGIALPVDGGFLADRPFTYEAKDTVT